MSWFKKKTETLVKCEDCSCLLYKEDAQEIIIQQDYLSVSMIPDKRGIYMCGSHIRPYDKVRFTTMQSEPFYYKNIPAREQLVDKKGKYVK